MKEYIKNLVDLIDDEKNLRLIIINSSKGHKSLCPLVLFSQT